MHNKQWKGKRNMSQNVLVVHGGGPTAVINASLYGVIEEAKRNPEVGKSLRSDWWNRSNFFRNFHRFDFV